MREKLSMQDGRKERSGRKETPGIRVRSWATAGWELDVWCVVKPRKGSVDEVMRSLLKHGRRKRGQEDSVHAAEEKGTRRRRASKGKG
jgi:hypothetical protein